MTMPPSIDQADYVKDLQRKLKIPSPILDRICCDRFGTPFASIDKRSCTRLLNEMIGWKEAPAEYRRAMGQQDLPGFG